MVKNLVSVIIPTFGGAEYLDRAVESVLCQTYPFIEIVVVDDNGLGTVNQKKTAEVMEKYKNNSAVKYVCHEVNKNGSAARNTGVKISQGEYIALLDDDDAFNPEKIEKQVEVLRSLGLEYALTYCSIEVYKNNTKEYEGHVYMDGDLLKELLLSKVEISTPTLVIRRSAYEEIGGFDESFRRHQDWEFLVRMADKYKFKSVDYVGFRRFYTYRNSPKNAETAKQYCEHYLQKMMPYIEKMDKKTQKDILIYKRLNAVFEFLKYKQIGNFLREYYLIKPGYRGIVFICKKVIRSVKQIINGEKLQLERKDS